MRVLLKLLVSSWHRKISSRFLREGGRFPLKKLQTFISFRFERYQPSRLETRIVLQTSEGLGPHPT